MATTASPPRQSKPATITTTLKVTVTKPAKSDMNAADFRREIDDAIELKKTIEGVFRPNEGGAVEGVVMIGKQKFAL